MKNLVVENKMILAEDTTPGDIELISYFNQLELDFDNSIQDII